MRKTIAVLIIVFFAFFVTSVYGTNNTLQNKEDSSDTYNNGKGQLVEIKEKTQKELEDYKELYGNSAYGTAAYILNKVRIYSIPLCFIGIAVAGIYQIIGIRKLDERDRGFNMMIALVTLLVICQLLPLIFAIVVKGWRG